MSTAHAQRGRHEQADQRRGAQKNDVAGLDDDDNLAPEEVDAAADEAIERPAGPITRGSRRRQLSQLSPSNYVVSCVL